MFTAVSSELMFACGPEKKINTKLKPGQIVTKARDVLKKIVGIGKNAEFKKNLAVNNEHTFHRKLHGNGQFKCFNFLGCRFCAKGNKSFSGASVCAADIDTGFMYDCSKFMSDLCPEHFNLTSKKA